MFCHGRIKLVSALHLRFKNKPEYCNRGAFASGPGGIFLQTLSRLQHNALSGPERAQDALVETCKVSAQTSLEWFNFSSTCDVLQSLHSLRVPHHHPEWHRFEKYLFSLLKAWGKVEQVHLLVRLGVRVGGDFLLRLGALWEDGHMLTPLVAEGGLEFVRDVALFITLQPMGERHVVVPALTSRLCDLAVDISLVDLTELFVSFPAAQSALAESLLTRFDNTSWEELMKIAAILQGAVVVSAEVTHVKDRLVRAVQVALPSRTTREVLDFYQVIPMPALVPIVMASVQNNVCVGLDLHVLGVLVNDPALSKLEITSNVIQTMLIDNKKKSAEFFRLVKKHSFTAFDNMVAIKAEGWSLGEIFEAMVVITESEYAPANSLSGHKLLHCLHGARIGDHRPTYVQFVSLLALMYRTITETPDHVELLKRLKAPLSQSRMRRVGTEGPQTREYTRSRDALYFLISLEKEGNYDPPGDVQVSLARCILADAAAATPEVISFAIVFLRRQVPRVLQEGASEHIKAEIVQVVIQAVQHRGVAMSFYDILSCIELLRYLDAAHKHAEMVSILSKRAIALVETVPTPMISSSQALQFILTLEGLGTNPWLLVEVIKFVGAMVRAAGSGRLSLSPTQCVKVLELLCADHHAKGNASLSEPFVKIVTKAIEGLTVAEMCSVLHSVHILGVEDATVLRTLLLCLGAKITEMERPAHLISVAATANRMDKKDTACAEVLEKACLQLKAEIGGTRPCIELVVHILHELTEAGVQHNALMKELLKVLWKHVEILPATDLAKSLSALAKVRVQDVSLVTRMVAAVKVTPILRLEDQARIREAAAALRIPIKFRTK